MERIQRKVYFWVWSIRSRELLGVREKWKYQTGAKVAYFSEKFKFWSKKSFCDTFMVGKVKNSCFFKVFSIEKTLKKQLFFTFPTIKVSQNDFFDQNLNFSEKYATLAPVWYFHFSRTPSSSRDLMLQTQKYTFLCIRSKP